MHNVILMVVIVVDHASTQITAQIVHVLELLKIFWVLSVVELMEIMQTHVLNVHLGVMGIVNGRMENVLKVTLAASMCFIRRL